MTSKVLSGVIALVSFRADGTFNFKQTISTKLTNMGARVTSRFSKDVTHVVFQKRLKPTHEQQLAEASDLRALYDKAAKASTVYDWPGMAPQRMHTDALASCNTGRESCARRIFAVG